MQPGMTLLARTFAIHRLEPDATLPVTALDSPFFAATRTADELSLVLPEEIYVESDRSDVGWACFKVDGPLAFGLVGILAGISSTLARTGISIFALSTFETDYVLVKQEQAEAAVDVLVSAGYTITREKS